MKAGFGFTIFLILSMPCLAQVSPLEYTGVAFLQPKEDEMQGNIRALIIGISDYRELPKDAQLQYAHSDALNFYRFLRSKAGGNVDSTSITLLLDDDATAAEIYAGLDWLLESQPNDRVIVYFAGHGDVERKTVRQRGFLLAHDAPRAGYQAGGTVTVMDLQDYLETLVVKNKTSVLLITDACRSGKLAGGAEGASVTSAALQEQWSSIAKILSSQSGEKSYESKDWGGGHGVFTLHLLDGLKGMADKNLDGFVSLSEINLYLSQEVPWATENKQNPMVSGSLQIKLSQVDPLELANVKLKKDLVQGGSENMLAMRSGVVTDTLSPATQKLYRQFRDALGQKNLIHPEGKSAFVYFQKLKEENPDKKELIVDLRRSLLSSLEASAQKVINKYMVNDKSLNEAQIDLAAEEISTSLQLMSSTDIRWKTMQARHLFLDNGFLQCICHGEESEEEEANRSLAKLRESLSLEPDAAYVYNSMGNVHYTRKNYDSARFYYLKAHDLAPKWSYPVNNLGTVYIDLKENEKAIEFYEKAIVLDPDYGHIYNNLGNLYSDKIKTRDKAIYYYQKAYEVDSIAFYYYQIGKLFVWNKKDFPKSFQYFNKIGGLKDADQAYNEVGILMRDLHKYDHALTYFLKSLAVDSTNAYVHGNLAGTYNDLRKDDLAIKSYQNAIGFDSTNVYYRLTLGKIYKNSDKDEEALTELSKGLEMNRAEEEINYDTDGFYSYQLANAYLAARNYDSIYLAQALNAIDGFEERFEFTPKNFPQAGDFWMLSSYIREQQLDTAGALADFEGALDAEYYPQGYDYMRAAQFSLSLEDYAGAEDYAKKGLRKERKKSWDYQQGHYLLACVHSMLENKEAALKELTLALEAGYPVNEYIHTDPNLAFIRQTPEFDHLIAKYKK